MKTKVTGKYVIGYDGNDHAVYENGCVVYEGDTIIFAGKNYDGDFDELIEGGNAIISPGFIDLDALGDIDHALIFSEINPDNKKHLYWCEEYFNNRRENMTVEEEAFKSLYAYSQLIMHGVTTAMPITSVYYKKCGETYEEAVAAAHHAGNLGLRVYLGPSYISNMTVTNPDGSLRIEQMDNDGMAGLERAKEFAFKFAGAYGGLINAVMVPERIELQTEEVILKTKEFAREMDCPVRLHAAQGEFEYNTIQKKYGKSTIEYLQSLNFLDDRTLIPHAIWASGYSKMEDKSDRDLDILIETGASVIHCPLVYSRGGTVLESFGRYIRKGVKMSMGTDTFPPDIIQNIRMGSAYAQHKDNNRKENSYGEFYRAATLGGAKALKRDDLGRLCEGAKADIIIIDLSGYHIGAVDDPIRTMGMCAAGRDVVTSIINGRVVMKNRVIPGFDYETAQVKAQQYYDKMKKDYLMRSGNKIKPDEMFPPTFKTC